MKGRGMSCINICGALFPLCILPTATLEILARAKGKMERLLVYSQSRGKAVSSGNQLTHSLGPGF